MHEINVSKCISSSCTQVQSTYLILWIGSLTISSVRYVPVGQSANIWLSLRCQSVSLSICNVCCRLSSMHQAAIIFDKKSFKLGILILLFSGSQPIEQSANIWLSLSDVNQDQLSLSICNVYCLSPAVRVLLIPLDQNSFTFAKCFKLTCKAMMIAEVHCSEWKFRFQIQPRFYTRATVQKDKINM